MLRNPGQVLDPWWIVRPSRIFLSDNLFFCTLATVIASKRYPPPINPSSGNVFADLGFEEAEAEHLRIRSSLMIQVSKLIEDRNLTQAEAAKLFGVTAADAYRVKEHLKRSRMDEHHLVEVLVRDLENALSDATPGVVDPDVER